MNIFLYMTKTTAESVPIIKQYQFLVFQEEVYIYHVPKTKVRKIVESNLKDDQNYFCKGSSTTDKLFLQSKILRILISIQKMFLQDLLIWKMRMIVDWLPKDKLWRIL